MIGSHNTMTYRPVRQWYFKPLAWTARCQNKTLEDQLYTYNCRIFDIRVKYTKNGDLTYAHGPIQFCGHVMTDLKDLNNMAKYVEQPVYVRIILESNGKMKDQDLQEEHFTYFCESIEEDFTNLHFFGGVRKYDWKEIYHFKESIDLVDRYSSTTSMFGSDKNKWYAKLDDLWPWLYAKTHNRKNLRKYSDKNIFIDFVNYGQN